MSDTKGSIEVIEISSSSSDEEEYESEDYDDDDDYGYDEGAGDDASPSPQAKNGGDATPGCAVAVKTVEEKKMEDDDCCILDHDPFDSVADDIQNKLSLSNGDQEKDLSVLAEKGKVACRDYPHSRHMCANFSFDKTPHEDYCAQCFCYVCDVPAPCSHWKGHVLSHCHASDQQLTWRNLRSARCKKPKPEPK